MNITGYHCNGKILADSNGNWTDKIPYLGFILNQKDDIKVFYDLDRDVACILKNIELSEQLGQKLFDEERAWYNNCKFTYFNNRLFGIDFDNESCSLSDTKQFRKTEDTLVKELSNPEQVIELAKVAKQTAEQVLESMSKFGLHPKNLISPISTYEKEIMTKLDIPCYMNIPKEVNDMAEKCLDGNWIEAYQIGHWDKVYDYDMNGAYPYQLAKLWDIRKGTWVQDKKYHQTATYSYCLCKITIDSDFSPIVYHVEKNNTGAIVNQNYTPTGTFVRILNKTAIEYIMDYTKDKVEIIDGQWFFKNSNSKLVFANEINRMWEFKLSGNEIDKEVAKRLYSGLWGKTQERYKNNYSNTWRYGKYNNYVYATEVEMNTKIEIAKIAKENSIIPLYINADGFITEKELSNIKLSNKMGEWKLNKTGKCFIIGDGTATIEDGYNNNGTKNKNMYNVNDLILRYDWLKQQILDNPKAKEYTMSRKTRVTLGMALNNYKWEELGNVIELKREIELEWSNSRSFRLVPRNGKDLMQFTYNSNPLDISMLKVTEETGIIK